MGRPLLHKREGRRMYCGRSRVRVPRTANFSNYYRYLDGSNDWRKANLSGIHLSQRSCSPNARSDESGGERSPHHSVETQREGKISIESGVEGSSKTTERRLEKLQASLKAISARR